MISLQLQYEKIAKSHKKLIQRVIDYIVNTYSISEQELKNEAKFYVRKALYGIKRNNDKVVSLRLKRKQLNDDISDLERAYCKGDSCESSGEGKNTGGRPNSVEERQIKKIALKERLGKMVEETEKLEQYYDESNQMMLSFINIIPQEQYIEVLIMTYIHCLNQSEIAYQLQSNDNWIKQARFKGIDSLVNIIKKSIQ